MHKSTSWGKAASWYDKLLEQENDTYQKTLILPNLLRLLEIKRGDNILDLACGQGFFAREFSKAGAKVVGVDISYELIEFAKKHHTYSSSDPELVEGESRSLSSRQARTIIDYHVSSADNLSFLKNKSIDKATLILALQNIENVHGILKECSRVLKNHGKLFIILNHPAFRVPKESSWGWDERQKIQYRRIDSYLSETKVKIQMHPGDNPKETTWSFHRPLQFYFKMLSKCGFCVSRLEEWNSNKISEPGPRSQAEDKARKEIPMFLFIESVMINI
jgi:ubiquinone/menaquinone biosynthesis C-methylase UbiE